MPCRERGQCVLEWAAVVGFHVPVVMQCYVDLRLELAVLHLLDTLLPHSPRPSYDLQWDTEGLELSAVQKDTEMLASYMVG